MVHEKNRIKSVNIVFLISMIISVVVAFLSLDFLTDRYALQLIFSQIILVLPSAVYMWKNKLSYRETVRFRKLKLADMALCILFGVLIQPAMTLINALSMLFATNTTSDFILGMSENVPFLGAIFLTAFVPCVFEESVYRGVFYNEYSKKNPWKAALLSGFLFGLMHGNINQFCYAAFMGIVFALLIEATGSILSTMLIHFWINAGSVVTMYLYPKLYEIAQSFYRMYQEYGNEEMVQQLELTMGDMTLTSQEWMQQMFNTAANQELTISDVLAIYAPSAIVMGILAFLVYKKLAKRSGNWERICNLFKSKPKEAIGNGDCIETEKEERLVTVPLVVAIIIGIAFMIFYEVVVRMA